MHHILTAAAVHEPHPSQAHGPPETKSMGGSSVPACWISNVPALLVWIQLAFFSSDPPISVDAAAPLSSLTPAAS